MQALRFRKNNWWDKLLVKLRIRPPFVVYTPGQGADDWSAEDSAETQAYVSQSAQSEFKAYIQALKDRTPS